MVSIQTSCGSALAPETRCRNARITTRACGIERTDALQFRASSKWSRNCAALGRLRARRTGKTASPVTRLERIAPRSQSLSTCRRRSEGEVQVIVPAIPRSPAVTVRGSSIQPASLAFSSRYSRIDRFRSFDDPAVLVVDEPDTGHEGLDDVDLLQGGDDQELQVELREQVAGRTAWTRRSPARTPRRSPRSGTSASGPRTSRARTDRRGWRPVWCRRASPSARPTCRRSRSSARAPHRPRASARSRRTRTSCGRR